MMFKAATAVSLAILLASGTMASAQSDAELQPANRADMQCMAIMAIGVGMMEEGSVEQLGLAAGMAYYLGRLEARAPDMNWLDAFGDYLLADFENDIKVQSDRCAAEMTRFGARMTSWGEKMQSMAPKQPTKPARPR